MIEGVQIAAVALSTCLRRLRLVSNFELTEAASVRVWESCCTVWRA